MPSSANFASRSSSRAQRGESAVKALAGWQEGVSVGKRPRRGNPGSGGGSLPFPDSIALTLPPPPDNGRSASGSRRPAAIGGSREELGSPNHVLPLSHRHLTRGGVRREAAAPRQPRGAGEGLALPRARCSPSPTRWERGLGGEGAPARPEQERPLARRAKAGVPAARAGAARGGRGHRARRPGGLWPGPLDPHGHRRPSHPVQPAAPGGPGGSAAVETKMPSGVRSTG